MSSDTVIADVEAALRRVLDPSTSAIEKQQLEQQLTSFKDTPAVCLPVLFTLLRTSQNEYALWFAATTLDEYVAKKWVHFPISDQDEIRQFVWDFLQSTSSIPFVRRKLQKVVADIARIQWRDSTNRWSNFLNQLETLIVDEQTRKNGLELLCVVVDEFGRDDALAFATVKRQAKRKLISHLPNLVTLLANVLTNCRHAMQTGEMQVIVEQDQVANVALTTLNTLITWAPVADLMTEAWLTLLFELAAIWNKIGQRGVRLDNVRSSGTAVQCLTELLTKRFVPSQMDELVVQILTGLCPLLYTTNEAIGQVADDFVDKLSEFVHVFLTHHLKRVEKCTNPETLATFLQSVYTLTRNQPHVTGFRTCLRIWHVFVSSLEDRAPEESVRPLVATYESGLTAVMVHLVERVSYKSNRTQLESLDDDDDVGTQSEYEYDDMDGESGRSVGARPTTYQDLAQLRTDIASGAVNGPVVELSERKELGVECLALVRRLGAIAPCGRTLFDLVLPCVQDTVSTVFFHLHELVPTLAPNSEPWKQHERMLHDLTLACAMLSSVCTTSLSDRSDTQWEVLQMWLQMTEYMAHHPIVQTMGRPLIDLHCEVLTSIRCALTCGLPLNRALDRGLQLVLETLDPNAPLVVLHTVVHFLGQLCTITKTAEIPSIEMHVHQVSRQLPRLIQGELFLALSLLLLNCEPRYRAFLTSVRTSLDDVAQKTKHHRVVEHQLVAQIQRECYIVQCLARAIETKPKNTKVAFFSVFEPSLPVLKMLLTTYVGTLRTGENNALESKHALKSALQVVLALIRLYAQLLDSIRKQMQKEIVAEMIQTFVEMFQDVQLAKVLYHEGTTGVLVLCGFLELLKLVVDEPTPVFASFVPAILELCFGPLKEPIFAHPESDSLILGYYVALIESLLANHFRSFIIYSGQFTADSVRERTYASDQAHESFLLIFQSLASVLSRDASTLAPRICTHVLGLLDRVDQAHGLFAFGGFQKELRMGFLATLMNVLTRGELTLLQDETIQVLYRVAAVDFPSFYHHFLPTYIQELLTPSQVEAATTLKDECLQWTGQGDLPTFTQEVGAFLNDLKVLQAQY